jgi:hypothetical protein
VTNYTCYHTLLELEVENAEKLLKKRKDNLKRLEKIGYEEFDRFGFIKTLI